MNRKTNNKPTPELKRDSYWQFLFQKPQLADWLTILLSCLVGYILIRVCYPTPATYSDAFSYVAAAESDQFSIYRPFGYSMFLQIVHALSHSMQAVIASQFILYAFSLGLFLLAVKRYYPILQTWLRSLLEVVITLAPTVIYMLNALMSDALFCCLIFIMLAMLLVLIHDDSWVAAGIYLAAFFCSLFVRYSAMFFPIAIIPILLWAAKPIQRWVTIALTCALFGVFYQNITTNMREVIHRSQFSTGFDGWQLANNGMHVLPYIDDEQQPDNKRLRDLHHFVQPAFNDVIIAGTDSGRHVTAAFLWQSHFPLKQYMYRYMQTNRIAYPVAWARLGGGLYAEYGKWLIMHYPTLFWKYYLGLNTKSAFYPTNLEMVGHYSEIPSDQKDIASWFDFDTQQPHAARYPIYENKLKGFLPVIDLLTWLLFAGAFVMIIVRRRTLLASRPQRLAFALLFVFGFVYYGTTTFASPIVIRYWLPMYAIKLAFVWMLLSNYVKSQND